MPKPSDETTKTILTMPKELHRFIKHAAIDNEMTMNAYIVRCIENQRECEAMKKNLK